MNRSLPSPLADSFLVSARVYIDAARVLIETQCAVDPIGLLASHGLELALKSFLLQRGKSEAELKSDFGHDLEKLWKAAAGDGLAINEEPPYWLLVLGHFHDAPYQFRYPLAGSASVIPDAADLGNALSEVLSAVEHG